MRMKMDARCDRSPSNRNRFIVVAKCLRAASPSSAAGRPGPRSLSRDHYTRGRRPVRDRLDGYGGKQVGFWLDAMTIHTVLTNTLKLRVPLVMGGMQWVGKPALAAAVSNAGALGMLTALTQPTPEALRAAIEETRSLIDPQISE